ncbi:MAG: hypothetical protein IKX19_08055, partial [Clostridia bacterium]|nr:hypothetical protein [Clostridia bacterium]
MKFRKTAAGILALCLLAAILPLSLFSCGQAGTGLSDALQSAVNDALSGYGSGADDEIVIYTTPDDPEEPVNRETLPPVAEEKADPEPEPAAEPQPEPAPIVEPDP